ncbi:MAG: transketolase family protein, partial [Segetibacter sp.]
DIAKRFEAYKWHVQVVEDGNDIESIKNAVHNAKHETTRPSLIKVRTHIAYGSPNKVDTAGAHGSPLGPEEVKAVKKFLGFDPEKSFDVPAEVLQYYNEVGSKGAKIEAEWDKLYASYKEQFPELAAEYELMRSGKLPAGWTDKLPVFKAGEKIATRKASGKTLNAIAASLPGLIGGSADLSPSTDTYLNDFESFTAQTPAGRNFHFGIREHAMGAALNGIALSEGMIPYGATFLIFSEYMRPPIRLAAIMKVRSIFIFTHDSIGLGEDGTTHQPVEQLISLRSIPNLNVIRPADANETAQAWKVAIEQNDGPVALILSRQGLPVIDQEKYTSAAELEKGAYVLSDAPGDIQLILIATGSEVGLIMEAQQKLQEEGINARVVSMPSWELFEKQDDAYKEKVFPKNVRKRLSVEAGSTLGWHKYVTDEGDIIGIDTFGESAPAEELFELFGFTVDNVIKRAKALISK